MQYKPKINLYDIQVSRNIKHALASQKSISSVKVFLFSILAITTFASIGQSIFTLDSKTSLADSQLKTNFTSNSSNSKIIK